MTTALSISKTDAWKIYKLIEELHSFLHQPSNYERPGDVAKWLEQTGIYSDLRHVYYDVVGEWFPVDEATGLVREPENDDSG